jgi:hypothetical protein
VPILERASLFQTLSRSLDHDVTRRIRPNGVTYGVTRFPSEASPIPSFDVLVAISPNTHAAPPRHPGADDATSRPPRNG